MKAMTRAGLAAAAIAALAVPAGAQPPEAARQRVVELAHQAVAVAAIDTLPKQLKGFYKAHRAEMPSLALEPEFPARGPERRFLVDRLASFPFRDLPRSEAEIQSRFGEKARGVGRLPWLVQEAYARLVENMKAGDKDRLGRISKMGDRYLRKLLVVGATSVVRRARTAETTAANWVRSLLERKPARLVTVAMANKTARIVWAVLARGETYRSPAAI